MSSPFQPGASVAAYLRDSGGAKQETSTDQQERLVRRFCNESSLTLTRIFADKARPGGSVVGREQFEALIEHFENGATEAGVIFHDYSRWSRNVDDAAYFFAFLRRRGYIVHSLQEPIPAGAVGRLVETAHLVMAEEYREQLSRNTRRGLHYMVSVHKALPGGRPPRGYTTQAVEIGLRRTGAPHTINRVVIDESMAGRVQRAFEMRAEGRTIREIHAELRLFDTMSGYSQMLQNEMYTGRYRYGDTVVDDFCPALIDPDTWRKVQAVREHYANDLHPREITSNFLLSGLVWCAQCGKRMVTSTAMISRKARRYTYGYYTCTAYLNNPNPERCHNWVRSDPAERAVMERLHGLLTNQAEMDALTEEINRAEGGKLAVWHGEYETARARLGQSRQELDHIIAAVRAAGHSPALLRQLAELETEEAALQVRCEDLERGRPVIQPQAAAIAGDAWQAIEQAGFRDRQLFIRSVVERVYLEARGGRRDRQIAGRVELVGWPGVFVSL